MDGNKALPVILYLHIPKAAGTTLGKMFERRIDCSRIYIVRDTRTGLQEIAGLPAAQRDKLQLVRGHFTYGLHEAFQRPFEYITILREPVDRVVSHYYYVLRNPTHYLHARVMSEKMSLKEYALGRLTRELDNGQVRAISGPYYRDPRGQCSRDLLELAKDNLQSRLAVVGLAEHFDETVLLLGERYGWEDMSYTRQNVTSDRVRLHDLPQETLDAIRQANALDVELYTFASKLLQDSIDQRGEPFQKRLATLRQQIGPT